MELPTGWYTNGLPGAECQHRTYCLRPMDRLPAIASELTGDFGWLAQVPRPLGWAVSSADEPAGDGRFLARARAEAIVLPPSFVTLLGSPHLLWGLRSMTGCWWSLDVDSLQRLPTSDVLAIRFLTDQQGALSWHLLVDGTAEPPVIVSHQDFADQETWEPAPLEHVYRCAASFESFMYRCWIENEIGFRTHEHEPLTPEQLAYLDEARRLFEA